MIIGIASGKGGTGKTTVAVHLASALEKACLLDCDVEEPNAHLFLKPSFDQTIAVDVPVPVVNSHICTGCGKCSSVCAYNAIAMIPQSDQSQRPLVFPHLCHGCGACSFFCPSKAMTETKRKIGIIQQGHASHIHFIHGKMNVNEILSPFLIRRVKEMMPSQIPVIIDAPPGTSCPVVAAIQGIDFCVLVTEPTPFGLNDLKLAVALMREMKISFGIVINRSDLGNEDVEHYCQKEKIPILLKIPFDRKIAEGYSRAEILFEKVTGFKERFLSLYQNILKVKNETIGCD